MAHHEPDDRRGRRHRDEASREDQRRWGYDPDEDRHARGVGQDERQFGHDRGWGPYDGERRADADDPQAPRGRFPRQGEAPPAGEGWTGGSSHAAGPGRGPWDGGAPDSAYSRDMAAGRQGEWLAPSRRAGLGGRSLDGPGDWGGRDGQADRHDAGGAWREEPAGDARALPERPDEPAFDRVMQPGHTLPLAAGSGGGGAWTRSAAGMGLGGVPDAPPWPADPARAGRRGPKGWTRSDERIRDDVCERLSRRHDLDTADVSVEVRQGHVRLDGTVADRPMKHAIEQVVDGCLGVQDIDNRLRIMRPGPPDRSPQPRASVPPDSPTAREEARGHRVVLPRDGSGYLG